MHSTYTRASKQDLDTKHVSVANTLYTLMLLFVQGGSPGAWEYWCVYVCMYDLHVCTHMNVSMHEYISECIYVPVFVCMHICIYTYMLAFCLVDSIHS